MRVLATIALAASAVVAFQQPEQNSPVMLAQGQETGRRLGAWTGAAGGLVGAAAGHKIGGYLGGSKTAARVGAVVGAVGGFMAGKRLNFRRRSKSTRGSSQNRPPRGYGRSRTRRSRPSYAQSEYGAPQQRGSPYGQEKYSQYGAAPQRKGQYGGEQEY
ncbi:hypothetical protein AeMF1_017822 [Aphanomyces euteiches]|nr:hypothetical protein AeMF1_017822 [Aphanomyces euteiches]